MFKREEERAGKYLRWHSHKCYGDGCQARTEGLVPKAESKGCTSRSVTGRGAATASLQPRESGRRSMNRIQRDLRSLGFLFVCGGSLRG